MVISKKDKERVLEAIRKGAIDAADLSFPNLIDAIILKMKREGIIELLEHAFLDKRSANKNIPFHILLTLAITAKMKLKTSLTDVPFAISNAETLSEIGWNIWDNKRGLKEGLMDEGTLRNIVKKYTVEELIQGYNTYVQEYVFPKKEIVPDIHILDCTELEVLLENSNYEGSEVVRDKDGMRRGYKMSTLRGITGDNGILEEIKIGSINVHDLELSREMVLKSKMLKFGDILINDRGFISRELMNQLKQKRGVDTYIPLKSNMEAYEQAVMIAKEENKWEAHPNKKRKRQEIAFVESLGSYWRSAKPEDDVQINGCVVHDTKTDEYFVIVTTDLGKTAKQIIKTYELRPEIEEDYRQIKDFWKIEDFKSTKYNFIAFHIVMVLIGYLFFQLYRDMEEGKRCEGKSLPVAAKKYVEEGPKSVIVYAGQYFGIFGFLEFIQLYASCNAEVKQRLDSILGKV
ncbi:transposase IS4 family protein [Caldicellulosiruptor obsidiansis OB47]|uniref:Transposase IS4 family protein n=1 Tax=Caldicellulosiruptor obsidiansis (strain ATCC BAA-2073 / JCM 16842 / OB47) TaxID=608506 RepID=D9TKW3_CALOO|nr:transposase [Caldicellulosiruptor obsidiansis]ADL42645.1 transposase IS4 family protein [Caldicellulosiruptor obsidiansis OB47]